MFLLVDFSHFPLKDSSEINPRPLLILCRLLRVQVDVLALISVVFQQLEVVSSVLEVELAGSFGLLFEILSTVLCAVAVDNSSELGE